MGNKKAEQQIASLKRQAQLLELKALLLESVADGSYELSDDIIGLYGRACGKEGVVMAHDSRYTLRANDGSVVKFDSMNSFRRKEPPERFAEQAAILRRDALSRHIFADKSYENEFLKQMHIIRPEGREKC